MSEQYSASPFSFEPASAARQSRQPAAQLSAADASELLSHAIEASGLATYHWNIETDEIIWSANASDVLGADPLGFGSGRAFASFLDPDNFTSRYDTVMRSSIGDDGAGVPFQIEYKFRPEGRLGRASLWIEDAGRWYAGPDGRPVEVFGTLRRIDDRHMRDQHLSFLGNCDPLTGMMNRGRMMEALGGAMSVAGRDGGSCAFLIAAINNLSVVNDAYGFEVADEVIINMSRRLRQVVRGGDALARYSGSKFGLILNNCNEDDLAIASERFLSAARESVIETERGPVWALLSIGGLVLPKHAANPNTALARAEEALTEARKLPSDGYVVYKPSKQRSAERTLNAHSATEIVRCLRESRFRLAFQPVVDAQTGEPAFHEALLRMADQAGELVAAGHLVPIAEKLGLVRLIDRAVVQMTTSGLHKFPDAKLSFNISGITATDPRWYPHVIEILSSNRDVADRLIVEITETVALGDLRETTRFVEQLRALGCGVAIDDFGAGYTSFRNLRGLPVDILKLDGTFCNNLSGNTDNQYFVRSLIDLAKTFGMKTVAEWVETEEDAALLRQWNVDLMQGNLVGEASLELPWTAAEDASPFTTQESVPFMLPAETGSPDYGEAGAPWDETVEEPAAIPAETAAMDQEDVAASLHVETEAEVEAAPDVEAEDDASSLPPVEEAGHDDTPFDQPMMEETVADETVLHEIPPQEPEIEETGFDEAEFEEAGFEEASAEASEAEHPVMEEPVMEAPAIGVAEAAAPAAQHPGDALETVEQFEEDLAGELDKLRVAIAALDNAFNHPPEQAEQSEQADDPGEPSFADLVSDTAMKSAG